MLYQLLVTSVILASTLVAQIEIPQEFSEPVAVRKAWKNKSAATKPLWVTLAGKRVLGNRAHVVVQVPDRLQTPAGLRLLEPLGDGYYVAGLDLTSALGVELLAGGSQTKVMALEPEDKLDASLLATDRLPKWSADESNGETVRGEMMLSYHADVDVDEARRELSQMGVRILEDSPYFQHFEVRVTPAQLRQLSKADWVQFLEPSPPPPQTKNNAISAQVIGTNQLQADPFSLTGRDVNIGIFDGGSVAAHTEFADRLTNVDRATVSFHATHVAGTMVAAGNDPKLKGMAPAAKLFNWTFQRSWDWK